MPGFTDLASCNSSVCPATVIKVDVHDVPSGLRKNPVAAPHGSLSSSQRQSGGNNLQQYYERFRASTACGLTSSAPPILLGNGEHAQLAVVSPLYAGRANHGFEAAALFLHKSLVACAPEVAWVPVFIRREDAESESADYVAARDVRRLLHERDFYPTKVLPLVVSYAMPSYLALKTMTATMKKYMGLRFVFCSTAVPYAIAIDDDAAFIAHSLSSASLAARLRRWSEMQTVTAARAKWGRSAHDCKVIAGIDDHRFASFQSRWTGHYWWYSDTTIFERSDFDEFWQRLKPPWQWVGWDHNM